MIKNRLRMSSLVLYVLLLMWSTYSATVTIVDYSQCVEDEIGAWQRFLVWMNLMEITPKCSSAYSVAMAIGWDMFLLMAAVIICETSRLLWKTFTSQENASKRELRNAEPTEELYLMRHASRTTGKTIVARFTATKEEVISYDPETRKFRLIMVLPRLTEEEYNAFFN